MTATTVSIINLKGGVGKSTLTMLLGEFLAFRHSKNVLLIDMDAQANLSYCMVPNHQIQAQIQMKRTVYHLLNEGFTSAPLDVRDYITQPPLAVSNISRGGMSNYSTKIHMVVSTPSVAQLDDDLLQLWELGHSMPKEIRKTLLNAIKPVIDDYDYILIDCPPGLSLFSSTALIASDFYLSPIIPEPLSLQGVDLVQDRIRQLKHSDNAKAEFAGVVLNIVKHYRKTHYKTSHEVFTTRKIYYQPFSYWLPDSELLRKIGEYDPDIEGSWAVGVEHRFVSLPDKYGQNYRLNNPKDGFLNRSDTEGPTYRLEARISRLVEEFMERCPEQH